VFQFQTLPPLSLYVHVPWCVRKCPYCDFNSHEVRNDAIPEQAYVDALLRDLEYDLPRAWGRRVQSVYLGGGTPSLFSAEAVDRLLSGLRARLPFAPGAEITLEANPGAVEQARFVGYRQAGVNRLSIGVQSFADDKLRALGRIHGGEEALRAAAAARAAGFENFNLDLMFGLPDQDAGQALADLETALAQAPSHLSLYQLTLEPNTLFHARPPELPGDESVWEAQQALQARLAQAGLTQYEISAYARPGQESRHNLNYWMFGDYLGIGAGAHGKLSHAGGVTRLWKVKHPREYLAGAGGDEAVGGREEIGGGDVAFEFMMNALRLNDGFTPEQFDERTGLRLPSVEQGLEAAQARGLLERSATRIRPTEQGRRFLNDLLTLFLPQQ
jgi:putative oxygen-independent coproporphyrinogen III oxidase